MFHLSVGFRRVKMALRARKSAQFTESGDESDGNDDNYCDEFIMSEKQYSSTSDEDTFLEADTLVLGKLIYHSMKIYTLSLIESMQSIFLFHV